MTTIISDYPVAEHQALVYDHDEVMRVFRQIGTFSSMGMPICTSHRSAAWFLRALWWLKAQRLAEWREIGTMHTIKEWRLTAAGDALWLQEYGRL